MRLSKYAYARGGTQEGFYVVHLHLMYANYIEFGATDSKSVNSE
jgi:hypothetical protein